MKDLTLELRGAFYLADVSVYQHDIKKHVESLEGDRRT
jgi:hypothetical protein